MSSRPRSRPPAGGPTPAPSDVELRPPDARQGPGSIPGGLLEALAAPFARRASRQLAGDLRSPGVGLGTELARLRAYEAGDDVRHLDAAASARTGQPHVRLHIPERALTTWILLDLSPSMAFGTGQRLKADVAEGVALVLGRLGIRRAGGLGLIAFGAGRERVLPLHASRPALAALGRQLSEGVAVDGAHGPRALHDALNRFRVNAKRPGLLAIISDFRGQEDWAGPLRVLAARHVSIAVEIYDPRERELPDMGQFAVVDPETGERIVVDTSSSRVRERFAEIERRRREDVATSLRAARTQHMELSTDEDWLRALGRGLE
ncbi:MAG TPA: DUF58 domain-containing protein [Solirubrobacteraceae bacterium]|nr:DUF58 domain-containing protein [Solirubrobacteraceae bacterium]